MFNTAGPSAIAALIWHTDDGGLHWNPQTSGVGCPLHGVFFLDEQHGWAAGGLTHPYTHTSTGVVLITHDGGKTWTHNAKLLLPAVRRIGFFNPRQGWAIACRSAMYPSGVFASDDGGRSWRPVPGGNPTGWTAADFVDPGHGIVAGRNGSLGLVRGNEVESLHNEGVELRGVLQGEVAFAGRRFAGRRRRLGAIRRPVGRRSAGGAELAEGRPAFRLRGIGGSRAEVLDRRLARLARASIRPTPDTPGAFSTPARPLPLRAMAFADDQHGWAAGELGTILATADGGRTWQSQRAGGAQAALLAVVAEPDDAPLELLARLSGSEGYLSVVEAIGRRDVEIAPRDDVPSPDRLHEAVVRVGGCAAGQAWQFPLRQAGLRGRLAANRRGVG